MSLLSTVGKSVNVPDHAVVSFSSVVPSKIKGSTVEPSECVAGSPLANRLIVTDPLASPIQTLLTGIVNSELFTRRRELLTSSILTSMLMSFNSPTGTPPTETSSTQYSTLRGLSPSFNIIGGTFSKTVSQGAAEMAFSAVTSEYSCSTCALFAVSTFWKTTSAAGCHSSFEPDTLASNLTFISCPAIPFQIFVTGISNNS